MKYLSLLLVFVLVLCLTPAALADNPLDNLLNSPSAAPTDTVAPTLPPAPGQIPSQEEDPHAEPSILDTSEPDITDATDPEPTATGHFAPSATVSPDEYGYDLEGILAGLPAGLPSGTVKQVEVYLRNLLNLKPTFDEELAQAQQQILDGDRMTAWATLLYYSGIFESIKPAPDGVRFVCFESALQRELFRLVYPDVYAVELPVNAATLHYLMGYIALEEDVPSIAVDKLKLAVSYAPVSSDMLYEYATALKANGDPEESLSVGGLGLQYALTPEHIARGYRELGYAAIEKGEYRYAACLYTLSMEYSADDSAAQGELDYIADKDASALDGLTPETAQSELLFSGVVGGLSPTAQQAMDAYRNDSERADDPASEEILQLWN